jgi:hypothetical protein
MCDDIDSELKELASKGVEFTGPIREERWGRVTAIKMPGGGTLGIYEPRHPTALGLAGVGSPAANRRPSKRQPRPAGRKPARPKKKAFKRAKR